MKRIFSFIFIFIVLFSIISCENNPKINKIIYTQNPSNSTEETETSKNLATSTTTSATNPPVNTSPTTVASETIPPTTIAPMTNPPTTKPLATKPPVTNPPATSPPETVPPTTVASVEVEKTYPLLIGVSRVDITPDLKLLLPIGGGSRGNSSGTMKDPLTATAVAISDGEEIILMYSIDNIGLPQPVVKDAFQAIKKKTNINETKIFISCTHIHTGPNLGEDNSNIAIYKNFLFEKLADAGHMAINDLKESIMSIGTTQAKHIAFVRRFEMRDGSFMSNPGVGNPDAVRAAAEIDETVQYIHVERKSGKNLILVNFQCHPDVAKLPVNRIEMIDGELTSVRYTQYSADYPHFLREFLESHMNDTICVFLQGAAGDVNHRDVFKVSNAPTTNEYPHSEYMGNTIGWSVLNSINSKAAVPVKGGKIECISTNVKYEYIPNFAKKHRHGINVFAFSVGEVAFTGVSMEMFVEIGKEIKDASSFKMTIICGYTNGRDRYLPTIDAFPQGYPNLTTEKLKPHLEVRQCSFMPGVGEYVRKVIDSYLENLYNRYSWQYN